MTASGSTGRPRATPTESRRSASTAGPGRGRLRGGAGWRLREHLGVRRWLLCGGSWGVTLALAYAERHPERVSALVLASVTITRPADVHWLYHEVGRYFPEQWERFRDGVPEGERDGDLVAAYHRLLNGSTNPAVRERAARDLCRWEDAWPTAELHLVATGHAGGREMTARTLAATNRFARLEG